MMLIRLEVTSPVPTRLSFLLQINHALNIFNFPCSTICHLQDKDGIVPDNPHCTSSSLVPILTYAEPYQSLSEHLIKSLHTGIRMLGFDLTLTRAIQRY